MVHCRTYSTGTVNVLRRRKKSCREKQNRLSSARQHRIERAIAWRACQSKGLCGHSVPGWQPSCQRLVPVSWSLVGLGVGMMALCCAVLCCAVLSGIRLR